MKKVMIVDDSIVVYEEMKQMLQDSGFEVAGYANCGENALDTYEMIKPDVITMDIILPGMDGLETIRKLRERWPEAKVLVISSLAYEATEQEASESGAKDFIYKPFEKDVLIKALQRVCGES